MSNFDLSLWALRCRRPRALAGSSHLHTPVRGRMKVDGESCSVAEVSGVYTPAQATVYARCVKRAVERAKVLGKHLDPKIKTPLTELA